MTIRVWSGLVLPALFAAVLAAQPAGRPVLAFEATACYTSVWRHTPKLSIRTGLPLWGQEWGLRLHTRGREPWQAWQRYPVFGLSVAHFRLGAQAHGDAWGLLPNLAVPLLRKGPWLAVFRLGTGLGYVTHPYDFFKNPGQNAIGSHWNNFTQFRLGAEFRPEAHWSIQAGAALSHFSNGASALPNYGVNLPGAFLSVAWAPAGIRSAGFIRPAEGKHGGRRWGALASGSLALIEYSIFDGPRYPVWGGSAAGYFQINRVNRLLLGIEYEYNRAVYAFGLQSGGFRTGPEARRGAVRLAATLAQEFLFGNLGVQVLAGVYTGGGINRLVSNSWYSKLTVRYYLPPMFHTPLRLHAGISLKAHRTTAEFISTNVGLVF